MKITRNKVIIAIVILLIIIVIVTCLVMRKNGKGIIFLKSDDNYKLDFTDKFVEDDYQKVTVTDISVFNNFFIIKYDIDLTEKGKKYVSETETNTAEGFSYELSRNIIINGDEVDDNGGTSYQVSEKIDDSTLRVYDIVEMENIPDKFNIDIEFIKTIEDVVSQDVIDLEEAVYKEHDETTMSYDDEESREEQVEEEIEEEEIDYVEEESDEAPEELIMEEIDPTLDVELAGRKTFKGTKEEASQNVEIKELGGTAETKDLSVNVKYLVKTPYAEFIIIKTRVDNINTNTTVDPDLLKFDLLDKNNNTIDCTSAQYVELIDTDEVDSEGEKLLAAEKTNIFLVNEKLKKAGTILVQPYLYELEYESDNVNEIMNGLTWYPIENEEKVAENEFGGIVTVKSVEQKDGKIYFNIEKKGFVPTYDCLIILRNKNESGFCIATECIEKDDGVCVYFEKQQVEAVNPSNNINDVQYTIMEPIIYTKATDTIEITL